MVGDLDVHVGSVRAVGGRLRRAQRVSGVADGLLCLPQVGSGARLGGAQRPAPGVGAWPGRQTHEAQGGHPGQPQREIRPARRSRRVQRKLHLLVDTLGRLLGIHLSSAITPERAGAEAVLARGLPGSTELRLLWVDCGYTGTACAAWVRGLRTGLPITVIKRFDKASGFIVLARRWIFGRTFG